MIRIKLYKLLIINVVYLLAACSGQPMKWNPDDYTVKSGDTIYSIAWRYEINPQDLARWNRLSSPNLIRPGQRLHTRRPKIALNPVIEPLSTSVVHTKSEGSVVTVKRGDTLYSLARKNDLKVDQLARYNGLIRPYVISPGQQLRLRQQRSVVTSAPGFTARKGDNRIRWQWPLKGKLLSKFNRRKNNAKGIDITGREGSIVKAAAPGKVVYSGNGLINYGNLVIIKHNRSYLSAYANNRKLLVREGQQVTAGQKIAVSGKTGSDRPKLHFEIRKNGKPVDPLRYLPSS